MKKLVWYSGLLLAIVLSPQARAADFNYRDMLHASMKLNGHFDFEAHVDSYMECFRPVVYKVYKNNEFAIRGKRTETVNIMKHAVEAFSLETEFVLRTQLELGNYDFDLKGFPVQEATESHYWYISRTGSGQDLPSRLKIYFENPELLRTIPMTEQTAQAFLEQRKSRYGGIDRMVHAEIRFKIMRLRNGQDEFDVQIQSAEFFDRKGNAHVLHRVKRKPVEEIDETAMTTNVLDRRQ